VIDLIAQAGAHELERLRLERSMDDAEAIAELADYLGRLEQWLRQIPMSGPPPPPALFRFASGPSSSGPARPTSPGGS
jgi:hypothetical protein